jgi:hypothetical protein
MTFAFKVFAANLAAGMCYPCRVVGTGLIRPSAPYV